MDIFLKITACVFVGIVLCLVLSKQNKDIAILLSIAVCCMTAMLAFTYLQPVVEFMNKLQDMSGIDTNLLRTLLKAVGIALVGEIANMICADAGYGAMGKVVQLLASCVVLWISLPLFSELLSLIEDVLGI